MLLVFTLLLLLAGPAQPDEAAYWYDADAHLWRIELSAGLYSVAAWDVPPQHGVFESLAWSPSGEWLAWVSASADTDTVQPGLTHLSGYATPRPDLEPFEHLSLRWLPVADWLLFVGLRQVGGQPLLGIRIYDVPADQMRFRIDIPVTDSPRWMQRAETPALNRSCADCRYGLPAPVIERIEMLTNDMADCQVELVRTSSHSTLLIHAQPEHDVFQPVGSLQGTCYGVCQTALPVIGQLQGSVEWYRVQYNRDAAWIDINDDGRLIGDCGSLPVVSLPADE